MMNLNYPPNAAFMANQIISILNADILDPSFIFNAVNLNFTGDQDLVNLIDAKDNYKGYNIINQIKDMEFETFNPILNVGGLFVVFMVLLLGFIIYFVISLSLMCYIRRTSDVSHEGG